MVKMISILRRLPNLSREEFQAYWRENHGPLAQEKLPAMRCKRYVQVHTMETPYNDLVKASRGSEIEIYDGVAELWFESIEDLSEALQTEEGQQASQDLLEDEKKFIDLAQSAMWFAEEYTFAG
jgi:uncharacterized protein (TIGR02118 family)